jgi:hypothetical protein
MGVKGVHKFAAKMNVSAFACVEGLFAFFDVGGECFKFLGCIAVLAKKTQNTGLQSRQTAASCQGKWLGPLSFVC